MSLRLRTAILGSILFFLIPSLAFAQSLSYSDTLTSNGGSGSDGAVWGGYTLSTTATSIPSQSDCLCWDWCDNGGSDDDTWADWDTCYCKTSTAQTQCSAYSNWSATFALEETAVFKHYQPHIQSAQVRVVIAGRAG